MWVTRKGPPALVSHFRWMKCRNSKWIWWLDLVAQCGVGTASPQSPTPGLHGEGDMAVWMVWAPLNTSVSFGVQPNVFLCGLGWNKWSWRTWREQRTYACGDYDYAAGDRGVSIRRQTGKHLGQSLSETVSFRWVPGKDTGQPLIKHLPLPPRSPSNTHPFWGKVENSELTRWTDKLFCVYRSDYRNICLAIRRNGLLNWKWFTWK